MKTCNTCNITKPLDEFYAHARSSYGRLGRCKECHKAAMRENRAKKIEYYREYDRERFQNDPRVRERHRRYQASQPGKKSMQRSRMKWLAKNQDKRAAHIILGNAVRRGQIDKPTACTNCGATGVRIHGHHEDYSKPLDVVWLCPTCHMARHA